MLLLAAAMPRFKAVGIFRAGFSSNETDKSGRRSLEFFNHSTSIVIRHAIDDDNLIPIRFKLVGELFERLSNKALLVVTGNDNRYGFRSVTTSISNPQISQIAQTLNLCNLWTRNDSSLLLRRSRQSVSQLHSIQIFHVLPVQLHYLTVSRFQTP